MLVVEKKVFIHKGEFQLKDNTCRIPVATDDKQWSENVMESAVLEMRRIQRFMTSINGTSQTYQLNLYAGVRPVRVDKEMFDLVSRALNISRLTGGAFDISQNTVNEPISGANLLPGLVDETEGLRQGGDYKKILLDKKSGAVFLEEKGMHIGFGEFGNGYAADRARLVMEANGITGGVIDIGGNLTSWGNQPDGRPWTIWKADPTMRTHPFSFFNMGNIAVANASQFSGVHRKENSNYGRENAVHNTAAKAVRSATVICENSETANALARAIVATSIGDGLNMINAFKNTTCIIRGFNGALYTSKNQTGYEAAG